MSDLALGIIGGLGTGLVWATISILVRSLSGVIPPIAITAIRSVAGGTFVLLVAVAAGYGAEIVGMPMWMVVTLWVSMLIAMGVGDTLFFRSMDYLGITRALTLSMLNPLLTSLIGIGLLGEQVTPLRAAGIALVLGGLVLIVSGKRTDEKQRRHAGRGIQIVFTAACCWACAAILMKPVLQQTSVIAAAAVRIPAAGVFLWLTPFTRGVMPIVRKSTRAERARLAAICALSGLGALCFTTGIKYGGVAVGNVLASTAPLFTLPFELWVLRSPQSIQTTLGALVTLGGIALMHL